MQERNIIATQTSTVKNFLYQSFNNSHLTTSLKCYLNAVTCLKNVHLYTTLKLRNRDVLLLNVGSTKQWFNMLPICKDTDDQDVTLGHFIWLEGEAKDLPEF
jgi:hypothetical protein